MTQHRSRQLTFDQPYLQPTYNTTQYMRNTTTSSYLIDARDQVWCTEHMGNKRLATKPITQSSGEKLHSTVLPEHWEDFNYKIAGD
jgi:hypothetical protein